MNNNILYIVSEDWYFLSHRLSLAIEAKKKGYKVNVLCKDTGKINIIKSYGLNCYQLNSDRRNISIINLFKEILNIRLLIKKLKPNIIHLLKFVQQQMYRELPIPKYLLQKGHLLQSEHLGIWLTKDHYN